MESEKYTRRYKYCQKHDCFNEPNPRNGKYCCPEHAPFKDLSNRDEYSKEPPNTGPKRNDGKGNRVVE